MRKYKQIHTVNWWVEQPDGIMGRASMCAQVIPKFDKRGCPLPWRVSVESQLFKTHAEIEKIVEEGVAVLTRQVEKQDREWDVHTRVYENQPMIKRRILAALRQIRDTLGDDLTVECALDIEGVEITAAVGTIGGDHAP